MVKVVTRKRIDSEETLGKFIGSEYYDTVIIKDTDLYYETVDGINDEKNIVAKFRKNVFSKEEQDLAYEGLKDGAVESQNRGMAAGPRGESLGAAGRGHRDWVSPYHLEVLDYFMRDNTFDDGTVDDISKETLSKEETRGQVWLRQQVTKHYEYDGWFEKWLAETKQLTKPQQKLAAEYVIKNYISETNYAQSVMSGIAGYFDRYPRIPYGRATSYTEKNLQEFEKCFPYLRKLNSQFRDLLPERWAAQKAACDKLDPRFVCSDTVFTTLTINKNWRTACHRDAGDLAEGFSNISGITGPEGKGWKGAELILPEYRIAVDLQPGDLLLVANHTAIHGNNPLIGDDNDRLTLVCYFREKLLECKSWDYEHLRKKFINERSKNKQHPLYRAMWNGVSPGCFESEEWYQYLKDHDMEDPYAKNLNTLDLFF